MTFVFDPQPIPVLPILGSGDLYPVSRVFCVGRNFADHAAEMGAELDRDAPFYFTKSAQHIRLAAGKIPIAPRTTSYHHEIELAVALGTGGRQISVSSALDHVFGYAAGLDMTRRDLQAAAKGKRRPWDTAKDAEASALIAPLCPLARSGHPMSGNIQLTVNGQQRQSGDLGQMVWSVAEIIADLSTLYELFPGDLILMGTPAGVGPVQSGDRLEGSIEGVGTFDLRMI